MCSKVVGAGGRYSGRRASVAGDGVEGETQRTRSLPLHCSSMPPTLHRSFIPLHTDPHIYPYITPPHGPSVIPLHYPSTRTLSYTPTLPLHTDSQLYPYITPPHGPQLYPYITPPHGPSVIPLHYPSTRTLGYTPTLPLHTDTQLYPYIIPLSYVASRGVAEGLSTLQRLAARLPPDTIGGEPERERKGRFRKQTRSLPFCYVFCYGGIAGEKAPSATLEEEE